jgi:hypothetical protein
LSLIHPAEHGGEQGADRVEGDKDRLSLFRLGILHGILEEEQQVERGEGVAEHHEEAGDPRPREVRVAAGRDPESPQPWAQVERR